MKGKVLTQRSDSIQVVSILDDNGRQIAIAGFTPAGEVDAALIGARPLQYTPDYLKKEMREAARAALQERDAHFLQVFMGYLRQSVAQRPGVQADTTPELSPGGRKLSFSFEHQPVDGPLDLYEVIIRRKRAARPDPG
jgi:hypothetical protein